MKAVRKITFEIINKAGQKETIVALSKKEFVLKAAIVKKNGYAIIKDSIQVSDTIVVGYTNIIKKCA